MQPGRTCREQERLSETHSLMRELDDLSRSTDEGYHTSRDEADMLLLQPSEAEEDPYTSWKDTVDVGGCFLTLPEVDARLKELVPADQEDLLTGPPECKWYCIAASSQRNFEGVAANIG